MPDIEEAVVAEMSKDVKAEANVLRTPEYLRIFRDQGLITFAVIVNGHESHHQISVTEYDTQEKIEKRMAETMAQVAEEVQRNKACGTIPEGVTKFMLQGVPE